MDRFSDIGRVKIFLTYGDSIDCDISNLVILDDIEISKDYLRLTVLIDNNHYIRERTLPDEIQNIKVQRFILDGAGSKDIGEPLRINNLVIDDIITKRNRDRLFVNEYIYKIDNK